MRNNGKKGNKKYKETEKKRIRIQKYNEKEQEKR